MLKKGFHGFCMALAVLILSSLFESHIYVVSSLFIGFIAGSTLLLILGAYLPVITAIKGLLSLQLSYFPTLFVFGCGILAGAVSVVKGIRLCLERFRPQAVYAILGMMLGSFYAILMGPTTLATPQAPLGSSNFHIPACVVGIILVLGMLIAFSRLYLYVHYPSDILGGVFVGLFAGWVGSRIAAKLLKCSPALARMCAPERPDGKEGRR